jgi:hypothetical protein
MPPKTTKRAVRVNRTYKSLDIPKKTGAKLDEFSDEFDKLVAKTKPTKEAFKEMSAQLYVLSRWAREAQASFVEIGKLPELQHHDGGGAGKTPNGKDHHEAAHIPTHQPPGWPPT